MKQKLKTSIAFAKNLFTTGAFRESGRAVEIEICKHIPTEENTIIVEFGMGHGNITKEILKKMSPTAKLYTFEVKEEFCEHVRDTIKDDRLIIINAGAEEVKKYVPEEIHSVIASIPFTFLSNEKAMGIIQDSYDLLVDKGYFSQALYTKFNFKKFKKIFQHCTILKMPNFPTEYVYHCQKIND